MSGAREELLSFMKPDPESGNDENMPLALISCSIAAVTFENYHYAYNSKTTR